MISLVSNMDNVLLAVKTGFTSWFLLAVGLAGIFCVLVIIKKIFKNK